MADTTNPSERPAPTREQLVMLGLIFAEMREFVSSSFGPRADEALAVIPDAAGPHSSAMLVGALHGAAAALGVRSQDFERQFGAYLFGRFIRLYPIILADARSASDVLLHIDRLFLEVSRFHPGADFPRMHSIDNGRGRIEMEYRSNRPLAVLAEGLIQGCITHFGEKLAVRCDWLSPDATEARFSIGRSMRSSRPRRRSDGRDSTPLQQ